MILTALLLLLLPTGEAFKCSILLFTFLIEFSS